MYVDELYHAWLRKGEKPKYVAKVPLGNGKYRYFYNKAEYSAYLKGKRKRTEKQSKTVSKKKENGLFDFVSGLLNEKVTDIKQSAASNRKLIGGFYKKHIVGATELLFPNRVSNEEIKDHKYIAKVQLADGSYRYFYDQSEYDAYLARKGYQDNEPDFMKDLPEIDGPMSFEEDSLEINEDFAFDYETRRRGLDDFDGDYYTLNCALCSSAYELRRRGYDVEAKPMTEELAHQIDLAVIGKYGKDATILEANTVYLNTIFKDPVIKEVYLAGGGSAYDSLKANVEPNTRGNLMMVWNDGSGGHSVVYECDSKGDLTIIDTQIITHLPSTAVMREPTSVNGYFDDYVSKAYVIRTDNLEFTEQGVDICAREN